MERDRAALLVLASLSIFLYGGAFYGWGPMQLLLEENGSFNEGKCEKDDVVCEDQTAALLNVRLVSQFTVLLAPVLGWLSDAYGPPFVAIVMTAQVFIGLVLLIFAAEYKGTLDWLLYLAFIFLGLAATSGGLLTVGTGLVFTGKLRGRVISGLNSLYDAGAVTYLGLWGIGEAAGTSLTVLVCGYLGLATICLGGYSYFFRMLNNNTPDTKKDIIVSPSELTTTVHKTELFRYESSNIELKAVLDIVENTETNPVETEDSQTDGPKETQLLETVDSQREGPKETHILETDDSRKDCPEQIQHGATNETKRSDDDDDDDEGYMLIANRSVTDQLKSKPFVFLCIFFSFHVVSNVWTLTTARDFLKHLGDDEYGNRYLTIFTLMTPVSLLALPFVDVAMHKFGFHVALQAVNVLAIASGTVRVASENLNVQILGFIIFSFFRCFLFSVSFTCLPSFISADATGRAVGFFYVASGILSFVNIPLATLAVEKQDGNFFIPNLILLLLNLPIVYVTWLIGKGLEKNQQTGTPLSRTPDLPT